MIPEEQRVAIAEACGMKFETHPGVWKGAPPAQWLVPAYRTLNGVKTDAYPPDYLNDLNAMQQADATLDRFHQELRVAHLYCILTGREFEQLKAETGGGQRFSLTAWMANCLLNATAAQRAESFLRTIGKWTEC